MRRNALRGAVAGPCSSAKDAVKNVAGCGSTPNHSPTELGCRSGDLSEGQATPDRLADWVV